MLTLEDCIGLCGLTEEEVRALARHEHIREIAAAELGNYPVNSPDGELCIKTMIKLRLPERRLPVEDQEVVRLLAAG